MRMQNDRRKSRGNFSVECWGLAICRALNCQIKCRNSWGQLYQVDLSIDLFDALHSLFVGFSRWMGFSSNSCITTVVMPSHGWIWRFPCQNDQILDTNDEHPPTKVESIDEIVIKYPQKVHKHRKESKSLEGTHLALPESGDEKLLGEGSHLPKPQGFGRGGWPAIVCKCTDVWKLNMQPWKGHVHNHGNAFRGRRTWDQDTHPKVD